jgi:pimeloyl-ACP methyl ester carboxylesterase
MFADVNGIRLYYESQGDGRAVVLVHGLGLSSDMWRYQVPALAQRYRVITLDTRGHGQSSKPPGPYDMAMYVEDLRQLLDFLGFEKPVLIGLSMGGGIVQSFALAHLERVLALGLISTGSDHTDAVRAEFFHNADTVEREGMSPLIGSLVPKWFAPASLEHRTAEVERTLQTELANDPRAWAAAARLNGARNWTEQLGRITCPVLYIGGAMDRSAPRRAETYPRYLPDVEVHLVPDVAHLLPLEVPDQVNGLLLRFLDRVYAAAS